MFSFKQYDWKKYNISLLILVLLLCLAGVFFIFTSRTDDSLYKKQFMGIFLGLGIAIFVSLIDYHFICKLYVLMYLFNIGLLLLVQVMGSTTNNAQRWLKIGPIQFQPSELSKIILILVFAKVFTLLRDKINTFWFIILIIIVAAVPILLILTQPALSTSLVCIFIFAMMFFAAGLSYKIIAPIIIIGVPVVIGLFWYVQQDFQVLIEPYQQERIMALLNPELYGDEMYQQINSIQAIGSGQLYGKLLDESAGTFRGFTSVPIRESDFIFSVIGEQIGFIGSCILIILFMILIFKCLKIAKSADDYLGYLIAIGIASMFMFQVFVNIGVATALLPNTGIPLPFVSYGLSSMISSMISIGVILNISLHRKKVRR